MALGVTCATDSPPAIAGLVGAVTPRAVDARSLISTLDGGEAGRANLLIELCIGAENDSDAPGALLPEAVLGTPSPAASCARLPGSCAWTS